MADAIVRCPARGQAPEIYASRVNQYRDIVPLVKVLTLRHPNSINLSTKQSFEELNPKRLNTSSHKLLFEW